MPMVTKLFNKPNIFFYNRTKPTNTFTTIKSNKFSFYRRVMSYCLFGFLVVPSKACSSIWSGYFFGIFLFLPSSYYFFSCFFSSFFNHKKKQMLIKSKQGQIENFRLHFLFASFTFFLFSFFNRWNIFSLQYCRSYISLLDLRQWACKYIHPWSIKNLLISFF